MYLAYIDESGSTGDVAKGGSKSFVLGCVLVRASQWADALAGLMGYRNYLKTEFGLPSRAEIKANHLLQNGGPFRELALTEAVRHSLYRGMLRLCPRLHIQAFALVIRKALQTQEDVHDLAWTLLFQTLERLTTSQAQQVVIFHDQGEDMRIRTLARIAQRTGHAGNVFHGLKMSAAFRGLIDHPVSRRSHQSQFLQLSDLVAYAAFRRVFPPPTRSVQIVPESMWDELGSAAVSEVNQRLDGSIRGIVIWPPHPTGPT